MPKLIAEHRDLRARVMCAAPGGSCRRRRGPGRGPASSGARRRPRSPAATLAVLRAARSASASSVQPARSAAAVAAASALAVCSGWVCVRPRPRSRGRSRTLTVRLVDRRLERRRVRSPRRRSQMKVSRLPFGPGRPGRGEAARPRGRSLGRGRATSTQRPRGARRRRTTPPADPPAAELELRLDHARASRRPARGSATSAGSTLASEMNETSTVTRLGANGRSPGSSSRALTRSMTLDARVVAKAPVELAVADVERDHPRGAALQQAVGEAAGGSADVEAVAARRRRRQGVERVARA